MGDTRIDHRYSFDCLIVPILCFDCGGRLEVVNDRTRENGSAGRAWERHVVIGCRECREQWHIKVDSARVGKLKGAKA